jgi:periplasmic divalent cation tolerance protein
MATDVRIVLVTVPADGKVGEALAKTLVEERLAACVNRIPNVTSTYRWEGKVEVDSEELLLIKSRAMRFEEMKQRIVELHPYDVPEVLAIDVGSGLTPSLVPAKLRTQDGDRSGSQRPWPWQDEMGHPHGHEPARVGFAVLFEISSLGFVGSR